ncbi:hypothetical protein AKO1_004471 [Acrasis kona]|uniref:BRCT domain-containing protein n=1 Tax=Acrasis kona TaxID=1008807 RepID=A0AAW2YVF3_9EUKA
MSQTKKVPLNKLTKRILRVMLYKFPRATFINGYVCYNHKKMYNSKAPYCMEFNTLALDSQREFENNAQQLLSGWSKVTPQHLTQNHSHAVINQMPVMEREHFETLYVDTPNHVDRSQLPDFKPTWEQNKIISGNLHKIKTNCGETDDTFTILRPNAVPKALGDDIENLVSRINASKLFGPQDFDATRGNICLNFGLVKEYVVGRWSHSAHLNKILDSEFAEEAVDVFGRLGHFTLDYLREHDNASFVLIQNAMQLLPKDLIDAYPLPLPNMFINIENSQCRVHVDSNDAADVLGLLFVFKSQDCRGCNLLFPDLKVEFDLCHCDLLRARFRVLRHQNTLLESGHRTSIVIPIHDRIADLTFQDAENRGLIELQNTGTIYMLGKFKDKQKLQTDLGAMNGRVCNGSSAHIVTSKDPRVFAVAVCTDSTWNSAVKSGFNNQFQNFRVCKEKKIPIVKSEWMEECIASKKFLEVQPYLLHMIVDKTK